MNGTTSRACAEAFVPARRVDVLVVDDSSPTAPARSPTNSGETPANPASCHRTEKNGLGRGLHRGFKWALERATNSSSRWTAISRITRMTSRVPRSGEDADLVLGHVPRRHPRHQLGRWAGSCWSRFAGKYVMTVTGMPVTTRRRLQMLPPPRASGT